MPSPFAVETMDTRATANATERIFKAASFRSCRDNLQTIRRGAMFILPNSARWILATLPDQTGCRVWKDSLVRKHHHPPKEDTPMAVDPVCKTDVDELESDSADYKDEMFFFCSEI